MTPFYHNPPSPLPLDEERNQDTDHPLFSSTSLSSSSTCPIYFKAIQDPGDYCEDQPPPPAQHHKHEVEEHNFFPSSFPTVDDHYYNSNSNSSSSINSIKASNCKQDDQDGDPCDNGSVKWMSSKMRLMKKMMNSDRTVTSKLIGDSQICPDEQQLQNFVGGKNNNSTNNAIRVCSDCNTTKTPLWRSGPRGPKSLCNACGIRQRKARRALAAAGNGGLVASSDQSKKSKVPKEKRSDGDYTKQCKKRCKLGGPRTKKQLRFDEFTISLSKNLAFHQVFPQDEKEAAILLMALSCGLVRG